jgi:hypothetical protein
LFYINKLEVASEIRYKSKGKCFFFLAELQEQYNKCAGTLQAKMFMRIDNNKNNNKYEDSVIKNRGQYKNVFKKNVEFVIN